MHASIFQCQRYILGFINELHSHEVFLLEREKKNPSAQSVKKGLIEGKKKKSPLYTRRRVDLS